MNTPLVIPDPEVLRQEVEARREEIKVLEKLVSRANRITRTDGKMVEEMNRVLSGDRITIPPVDELKNQIKLKGRELTVVRRLAHAARLAVEARLAEKKVLEFVAKRSASG